MQQEKIRKIICWLPAFIVAAAVFYFSSKTANESSAQSGNVLSLLEKLFGSSELTNFIVRKLAHFLEFTALGFFAAFGFSVQQAKDKAALGTAFLGVASASIYAVTDELHQIFVDGRACRFTDWAIDTAGALLGALVFLAAFMIFKTVSKIRIDRHNN